MIIIGSISLKRIYQKDNNSQNKILKITSGNVEKRLKNLKNLKTISKISNKSQESQKSDTRVGWGYSNHSETSNLA